MWSMWSMEETVSLHACNQLIGTNTYVTISYWNTSCQKVQGCETNIRFVLLMMYFWLCLSRDEKVLSEVWDNREQDVFNVRMGKANPNTSTLFCDEKVACLLTNEN